MAVELPHFAALFEIGRDGATVVEQGTSECKAARVFHVAVCPEGFREDNPSFGIPELAFQTVPLNLDQVITAIERWEPEAELEDSEQAEAMNQALRRVGIEVS